MKLYRSASHTLPDGDAACCEESFTRLEGSFTVLTFSCYCVLPRMHMCPPTQSKKLYRSISRSVRDGDAARRQSQY